MKEAGARGKEICQGDRAPSRRGRGVAGEMRFQGWEGEMKLQGRREQRNIPGCLKLIIRPSGRASSAWRAGVMFIDIPLFTHRIFRFFTRSCDQGLTSI